MIRKLPLKSTVKSKALTRQDAIDYYRKSIQEEWKKEDDYMETAFKKFGLLPDQFDLKQWYISEYTKEVAGFYNSKEKTFYYIKPGFSGSKNRRSTRAADQSKRKQSQIRKNLRAFHLRYYCSR